jgi:hypothetical protein
MTTLERVRWEVYLTLCHERLPRTVHLQSRRESL